MPSSMVRPSVARNWGDAGLGMRVHLIPGTGLATVRVRLLRPLPERGERWGEGLYELELRRRAPLTRLASLATLSPSGRGKERSAKICPASAAQPRRPGSPHTISEVGIAASSS